MRRWIVLCSTLACAGQARAMRVDVPTAELCRVSSHVVVGEVTTTASEWTQEGSLETVVDVAVSSVLRGSPVQDAVVVTPGGAMGELRQIVEDAARLDVDTRYVLLLHERADGRFVVTGGEAGAFPIPAGAGDAWIRSLLGACLAR
jgi:hypothetical protein